MPRLKKGLRKLDEALRKKNHFRSGCEEYTYSFHNIQSLKGTSYGESSVCLFARMWVKIPFLLDLGANFIPGHMVPGATLLKYNSYVEVFGGGKVPTIVSVCLPVSLNDLDIVRLNSLAPLCRTVKGKHSEIDFRNHEFSGIFKETPGKTVNHNKATVHVCEEARSRYIRARHVHLALCDDVNDEIEAMIRPGTLEKVHTLEWAAPIVTVMKPNSNK
ncbi:unnamed protein product [Lepeophtheirus salmonis]|uniref:(salmon louse) hypothetical protein n=1 Tax=Lepeophtheirus salmonis TaxID=72036 RepID=A0A7R8CY91_LEPSM|nr:unnamed protein product [Lepeophtheirus salmonis]CAF2967980.1 unnamed protein product [Lepeophtheirus salmonis]